MAAELLQNDESSRIVLAQSPTLTCEHPTRPHKSGSGSTIGKSLIMAANHAYLRSFRALREQGLVMSEIMHAPAPSSWVFKGAGFRPYSSSTKDQTSTTPAASAPASTEEEEWTEVVHASGEEGGADVRVSSAICGEIQSCE